MNVNSKKKQVSKKTVSLLSREQEEQRIILDSIPAWIFYKDKENRFVRVNKAFCDIMGMTKEQLEGKSCFDLYPLEQAKAFWKDDLEVINSKKSKRNIIEPMNSPKGTRWVQTDKMPFIDEEGNVIGVIGFTVDISDQKIAEDELKNREHLQQLVKERTSELEKEIEKLKCEEESIKESENKFKTIFEGTIDGMFLVDLEARKFVLCNEACSRILGYSKYEFVQLDISAIHPAEDLTFIYEQIGKIAIGEEGAPNDIRFRRKDGSIFLAAVSPSIMSLSGKNSILIVFRDVAQQKQMQEYQSMLVSIIESTNDIIGTADMNGKIIYLNKAARDNFGISDYDKPDDYNISDFIPNDLKEYVFNKQIPEAFEKGIWQGEFFLLNRDKKLFPVSMVVVTQKSEDGTPISASIIARDITEQKNAQEEQDRFFNLNLDLLCIAGTDGFFKRINPAWEMTFGFTEKEFLSKQFFDFIHPDDIQPTINAVKELSEQKPVINFINRYRCKDGSYRWLSWVSAPYKNSIYAAAQDITDLKSAQINLAESERRWKELIDSLPQLVWTCRVDGPCDFLSTQWINYTGITEEEQLGYGWLNQLHPDDRERVIEEWTHKVKTGDNFNIEFRIKRFDGSYRWFRTKAIPLRDNNGEIVKWFGSNTDFDDFKKAERELIVRNRIANIFLNTYLIKDNIYNEVLTVILDITNSKYGVFGYIDENGALVVPSMTRSIWNECSVPEKNITFPESSWGNSIWPTSIREKKILFSNEPSSLNPEGHIRITRNISAPIIYRDEVIGLLQVANKELDYNEDDIKLLKTISEYIAPILSSRLERDLQERAKIIANENLNLSEARYRNVVNSSPVSLWEEDWSVVISMINDLKKDIKENYLEFFNSNPDFVNEALTKVKIIDVNNETLKMFQAEDKSQLLSSLQVVFSTDDTLPGFIGELVALSEGKLLYETEMKLRTVTGELINTFLRMTFPSQTNASGKVLVSIMDITEIKKTEEKLLIALADLERSNTELEQFAYVASHDLQEPLRMVSSYTQLLERRYKDKLDQDANEFINYAVDGANRMQRLINDLLEYSRITTRGKELLKTDLSSVLGYAIANLSNKIQETNALITNDDLPFAYGDETQLIRLFQNLIDNALKFRRNEPPRINIGCSVDNNNIIISVQDNGIGIDEQFKNRVFTIFQRLHNKNDYPGTGIGLSICKRIVERHGGKIWFESNEKDGTTFYFTLKNKGV